MMIKHEGKDYFGKELLVTVYGCNDNIHQIEFWKTWFQQLISLINMKAHGELQIDKFGEGELYGISAMQFIETSSIVMHNEKRNNGVHLDIFSCAEFQQERVFEFIKKTLTPDMTTLNSNLIYR